MNNYQVFYEAKHDSTDFGFTVIRARNEAHAKKYFIWLNNAHNHSIEIYPTNEDEYFIADRF